MPRREIGGSSDTQEPAVVSDSKQDARSGPLSTVEHRDNRETAHRASEILALLPQVPQPPLASPSSSKQASNEGAEAAADPEAGTSSSPAGDSQELSEEEQREVEKLKDRDREVRAHEQAHVAAAGPYSRGGPKYEYERGPDSRRYAVGGEVGIDTSPVEGDPEATIQKARVVKRAALAPAEPSGQDRQVAAEASRMETEARREIAKRDRDDGSASGPTQAAASDTATEVEDPEVGHAGGRTSGSGSKADAGDAARVLELLGSRQESGSDRRGAGHLDILA